MRKRMKVYVCNICDKIEQPLWTLDSGGGYEVPPKRWFENRDFHMCDECYRAFKKLKEENNCLSGENEV